MKCLFLFEFQLMKCKCKLKQSTQALQQIMNLILYKIEEKGNRILIQKTNKSGSLAG